MSSVRRPLFHGSAVAHREGDEPVVQGAEEDDGHDHHATDEAEGPAGSQEGVNVGDENRAQGASAASRRRQPAHVHTLENTFTLSQDAFIPKKKWQESAEVEVTLSIPEV